MTKNWKIIITDLNTCLNSEKQCVDPLPTLEGTSFFPSFFLPSLFSDPYPPLPLPQIKAARLKAGSGERSSSSPPAGLGGAQAPNAFWFKFSSKFPHLVRRG